MPKTFARRLPALIACVLPAACAGYRGGWESLPYVGEAPPAPPVYRTPFEAQQRSELDFPGLTLGISINNQIQTYQKEVYLYALPLSIDPRDVHTQHVDSGKTRVTLRISHHDGDFVLRPRFAMLTVGNQQVSGVAAFEFGRWDPSGTKVSSGGVWGYRPIPQDYALTERGRTYIVSVDFPLPAPGPDSPEISLDLSNALQAPGRPAIPLIRFLPVRFREGYT